MKYFKRGNVAAHVLIGAFIFIFLFSICFDIGLLSYFKKKYKDSVDLASKGAAFNIKKDGSLASGNFQINESEAKDAFYQVLSQNLNKSEVEIKELVKELEIINVPGDYYSTVMDETYYIGNPSVFVVIECEYGLLSMKKKVVLSIISSTQLTSVYD